MSTYDSPTGTYDAIGLTYDEGVYVPPVTPTPTDTLKDSPALVLNFSDVAVPTALVRGIGIDDSRLYPRRMEGYPAPPFLLCLDYQQITQEIMLVTYQGVNYWDVERNFDNSGLYTHEVGSTVLHSTTAFNYNIVNHHIHDSTVDWHGQYMDDFRHANPARHTIQVTLDGITTGTLTAGSPEPSMPGDAASEGTSAYVIASDHIHPRESVQDILIDAVPVGVILLVNTQKKTDFFWLSDVVTPAPTLVPAPYADTGVKVPLSMLGLPSESTLTFGGRVGPLAPSVDPKIIGVAQP